MTDDEHEAYGAMVHRGKAEAAAGGMTTKDDALIEAMLDEYHRSNAVQWKDVSLTSLQKESVRMDMRAALKVARKAILEEAATIADRHRSKIDVNEPLWHNGADWACDRIAAAIRALANKGGA